MQLTCVQRRRSGEKNNAGAQSRVGKIRKKKEKERKKKPSLKVCEVLIPNQRGGAGNGREEKKLHIKLLMRTAVEILTTPAGDAKRAAAASRLILAAE